MKTLIRVLIVAMILGCGCDQIVNFEEESELCMSERWERLTDGKPLGKRIIIPVPSSALSAADVGAVDLFTLNGKDRDACQIAVTLLPPQAVSVAEMNGGVFPADIQSISGQRYYPAFATVLPGPGTNFQAVPAIARIEWGIGGLQSVAEVDFSNGVVINLTASFVRITGWIDLQGRAYVVGAAIVLGAFVGPGYPRSPGAQRTYYVPGIAAGPAGFPTFRYGPNGPVTSGYSLGPIAGGLAAVYPVPSFGKQAMIFTYDPNVVAPTTVNTFDADLIFYRDVFASMRMGSFRVTNDRAGPILIPNGAAYWSIQNNVATTQELSVIFDLSI